MSLTNKATFTKLVRRDRANARPRKHPLVLNPMVPAAIYSVTLAVAARRLQDAGCPCLTSAPSGTSYPTFTLAGQTITYDSGEMRVVPKPQTRRSRSLYPVPVIVS